MITTLRDRRIVGEYAGVLTTLAIPTYEKQCSPWVDVLEYLQLRNWMRKGIYQDDRRADKLRKSIVKQFSSELLTEIDEGAAGWWIG